MKYLVKHVLIALLIILVIASTGLGVYFYVADNQREPQNPAQITNFSTNPGENVSTRGAEIKHEHNYIAEIKKASCVEGGYTRHTCVCGDTYLSDKTKATEHTYGVPKKKEATCTSHGGVVRICSTCGHQEFKNKVNKLGHTWCVWQTVKNATKTAEGEKTRTCGRCGKTEKKTIAKISDQEHKHSYRENVIEATCTKEGYIRYTCSCGKTYDETIPVRSHLYGDWKVTVQATATSEGKKEATCERCGYTITKTIPKLTADTAETYEKYIDSRIEITKLSNGKAMYYYYPVSVVDARLWGDPPAIEITSSGGFRVTYLKQNGSKVQFTLDPVEGYVRRMVIQSDGSYTIALIGGFDD